MIKLLWLLAPVAAISAGCGAQRVTVSGHVSVAGTPLEKGTINFEPLGAPALGWGTIENGRFDLLPAARLLPGKNRVQISTTRKTGRTIPAGTPLPRGTLVDEIEVVDYPPQEADLALGKNEIDFDLP